MSDPMRPLGLQPYRGRMTSRGVADAFERDGIRAWVLDLRGVRDKASLLERWGEAIDAPPSWGRNWDALDELMAELRDRAPDARGVIVVTRATRLARDEPETWRTALDVLRTAVERWREDGASLLVLLRGSAPLAVGE